MSECISTCCVARPIHLASLSAARCTGFFPREGKWDASPKGFFRTDVRLCINRMYHALVAHIHSTHCVLYSVFLTF